MEPLKNLFNKDLVSQFSNNIYRYDNTFRKDEYLSYICKTLEKLELKDRMRLISSSLHPFLNQDYKNSIKILKKVKAYSLEDESISLQSMILPDYVEVYGLNDLETSLDALEVFTINSSSEFAIRQFILKYEDKTMFQMSLWAKSENEHLRRLASEGCRPRLPWAIALPKYKKDPTKVLEIIELLKNDESLYVRKSVANNLNDISKDNPNIVIKFVRDNLGSSKNLDWICKHASRTLLKAGNKEVLELFGYLSSDDIKIKKLKLESEVSIGEKLDFSFVLITEKKELGNIRLEYGLDFLKANGKHSRKVFMISQNEIKEKTKEFKKYQNFKEISTRKYYKGLHKIAIIVNGEEKIIKEFKLI